jgi:hypothetical protein
VLLIHSLLHHILVFLCLLCLHQSSGRMFFSVRVSRLWSLLADTYLTTNSKSSRSHIATDGSIRQSSLVLSSSWCSRPDISYCLTVTANMPLYMCVCVCVCVCICLSLSPTSRTRARKVKIQVICFLYILTSAISGCVQIKIERMKTRTA